MKTKIGVLQEEYLVIISQMEQVLLQIQELIKTGNLELVYANLAVTGELGKQLPGIFSLFGYEKFEYLIKSIEDILSFCKTQEDLAVRLEEYSKLVEQLRQLMENIVSEKKAKQCSCCGERVYYKPLPDCYEQEKRKYGAKEHLSETLNKKEYICPNCMASDRDRLIIAFLKKIKLEQSPGGEKLLQIAPSAAIEHWIYANCPSLVYHTMDLYMKHVTFQADIQDMRQIASESYDFFICSHVLEHVENDEKAMGELHRILADGGIGIFLVPISLDCEHIEEEWGLTEAENWKRFGQGDHCRRYAKKEMIERLERAGFSVHSLGLAYFGKDVFEEAGLTDTSTLYVLTKGNRKVEQVISDKWKKWEEQEERAPLVSVLMSAYNHKSYVAEAIESILNQTYKNIEFLIADDCSVDGTVEEILKYEDKAAEIHLFDTNEGGRLRFLKKRAKGKYVAVINSDDLWGEEKLQMQVAYLENHPECAACFTGCVCFGEDGEEQDSPFRMENKSKEEWFRHFYEWGNCLPHPSILIRREVYQEIGGQGTAMLRQLPDFMMWVRLVQKYELHVIERPLTFFRMHQKGENKNVSACTRENNIRHVVEETYIWYDIFRKMDNAYFLKVFADILVNKNAKLPYEVMCEKLFVLLKARLDYCKQAAIFYLYDIYQIPEVAALLEEKYSFGRKDIYKLVVEVGPMASMK